MKEFAPYMTRIAAVTGIALGAFTLTVVADWTAPLHAPPSCPSGEAGCDAPINVTYGGQVKLGSLSLNGLVNAGGSLTQYGLLVNNSPIKAAGGLIIETRTTDPVSPETGRMWLKN